ncbi:MAG TPA: hypothetical protein PK250_11980 [Syntrophobacter fumaroxidans]|nr:hypothetical protein [Syntrophobacter fumaroxidans]
MTEDRNPPAEKTDRILDLHNHILPGLDDGADDWPQSLAMARLAVDDGVSGIVCTPHWISGFYDNTAEMVLDRLESFRRKLAEERIPLSVYPGSELRLDADLAGKIKSGEVLTLNDTGRYALIEFPDRFLPGNMDHVFWQLQSNEITPVLSHPERHGHLMRNAPLIYRWVEMGVLVQITSASLLGRFGSEVRKFSVLLMSHNLAHILATDAHGLHVRTPRLSDGLSAAVSIVGEESARRMVDETPWSIIRGEPVRLPDPVPLRKASVDSPLRRFFSLFGVHPH